MKTHIAILSALIICVASCSKNPDSSSSANDSAGPQAFKGQVYRSLDDREAITLTSPEELEIQAGNTNLICKYTKQGDTLRIVANVMGTTQAIYYRVTDEGLRDSNGGVLYDPTHLQTARADANAAQQKAQLDAALCAVCGRGGDIAQVTPLLEKGASANAVDREQSALALAVMYFHTEIVDLLLAKGADPNRGTSGATPLQLATVGTGVWGGTPPVHDSLAIVQSLLKAGADPNRFGRDSQSPLCQAALNAINPQMVEILIKSGAKVNVTCTNDGSSALAYSIYDAQNLGSPELRQKAAEIATILRAAGAR
jgi:ankyrin repeat protein